MSESMGSTLPKVDPKKQRKPNAASKISFGKALSSGKDDPVLEYLKAKADKLNRYAR